MELFGEVENRVDHHSLLASTGSTSGRYVHENVVLFAEWWLERKV